jgi:polyhydroxybutyrate depolymerase
MSQKVILLIALAISLLCLSACSRPAYAPGGQAGDRHGSIAWDGLERTFLLHVPASWNGSRSLPLVIALHGGGGTGEDMAKLTQGGFNALADQEGFIVVYPDGTRFSQSPRTRWNDGRDARYSQADDVGFLSALIDHLSDTLDIDRSRVYATGISNGAHMAMRLARELSDKVAAVAPVAYAMQMKYASVPAWPRPVSVLVMTGTEDPLIPWDGGETPDLTGERMLGRTLSVPETVRVLSAQDGCPATPEVTMEPDRDPEDGTLVRREVYTGCQKGTEVILVAIEGGGHAWPGGWQYAPAGLVGRTSRDIDACRVIWDFFSKHAK